MRETALVSRARHSRLISVWWVFHEWKCRRARILLATPYRAVVLHNVAVADGNIVPDESEEFTFNRCYVAGREDSGQASPI